MRPRGDFRSPDGTIVASKWSRAESCSARSKASREEIMKAFIAIVSGSLLCSCADMYVTRSQVNGGGVAAPVDAKDFGSRVRMITANCGVGAYGPSAIYIRPFCIDTASFRGDEAQSDGELHTFNPIELPVSTRRLRGPFMDTGTGQRAWEATRSSRRAARVKSARADTSRPESSELVRRRAARNRPARTAIQTRASR